MSFTSGRISFVVRNFGQLALAIFVLLAVGAVAARAQGTASVGGVVTDATGTAIPTAGVKVRNLETGAVRSLISGPDGRYEAPLLAVGNYEVSGEKTGFQEAKASITLVVGESATINLTLPVAQLEQVVQVEESAVAVSATTTDISGLVAEQQVKNLPLNGRSYDQLLTLNPGVVNYSSQRAGGVGTSNSVVGNMFSASGRRPQENLFLLNGVEFTSASEINNTPGGTSGQLLGVDAVREFSVETDTYGAEYGKRPGAQVNIVTASGTNQLHGSAYEFLRNSALDARNYFDEGPIPNFERNVFGGALGGPIKKNKSFFFANYEGFRQALDLSDVTLVPDNATRTAMINAHNVNVPLLALWPLANGPELGGGIAESFSHPEQTVREDFGYGSDRSKLLGKGLAGRRVHCGRQLLHFANCQPDYDRRRLPSGAGGQPERDPCLLGQPPEPGNRRLLAGQLLFHQWHDGEFAWLDQRQRSSGSRGRRRRHNRSTALLRSPMAARRRRQQPPHYAQPLHHQGSTDMDARETHLRLRRMDSGYPVERQFDPGPIRPDLLFQLLYFCFDDVAHVGNDQHIHLRPESRDAALLAHA